MSVHTNPFLKMDPRCARVVNDRELIPDEARESLKQEVRKVLAGVPPFYIPSYRTYIPVETTEWLCVEDSGEPVAIRVIGGRHVVIARDANSFEVSEDKGSQGRASLAMTPVGIVRRTQRRVVSSPVPGSNWS